MADTVPPVSRRRAAAALIGLSWAADRRRTLLAAVLFGLQAVAQSLFAYWLKLVLDALATVDGGFLGLAAAGTATSISATVVLSLMSTRVEADLRDEVMLGVDRQTIDLIGHTPTLEIHEAPRHLTQLEALRREEYQLSQVIPRLLELLSVGVRMIITAALLVSVDPLLLFVFVFGVPALLLSPRTGGLFRVGNERAADPARRAQHLIELTATVGGAKEVRLFRLGAELMSRFHADHQQIRAIHHRLQLRAAAIGLMGRLIILVGYFAAIVLVVWLALTGAASVGDVVLVLVLTGQILGLVTGSAELLQLTSQSLVAATRFVYLQDVSQRATERVDTTVTVPTRLSRGIRLENVSYRYPFSDRPTLDQVNLWLPAGSTVALVGENGAGKTTLVKLLAGLYHPSDGRITIDGVDLATLDPARWRQRLSAGFQDHARFELLVRETIGIGDLSQLERDDAAVDATITDALTSAAGADVLRALPSGLDTQLGSAWDHGVDLSGGQWQKLALGRAMMRKRPLLLLLDEPTAALDADTEHHLFEQWTHAARRLRDTTGGVTILVSHRFSTVRMADLIVVTERGQIVEVGTHTDLIAAGRLYAELFEIQARSYR